MRKPSDEDIAELEPYSGPAFAAAVKRLSLSPWLPQITANFFPNVDVEELKKMASAREDGDSFARDIMSIAVKSLINRTTGGVTLEGAKGYDSRKKYLFLSNHRDIIADSALLSLCLIREGFSPPLICLGDNLLFDQWATDLLKVCKGVIVKRNLSQRALLRWSQVLSHVIFEHIRQGKDSVWLAQREGRSKDGVDRTHPGVIKMLGLGASHSLIEHLTALNIIPTSISYEFDPCDVLKAREWVIRDEEGSYTKAPGEDRQSMVTGMMGEKGRVKIVLGKGLDVTLDKARSAPHRKAQVELILEEMDCQIVGNYHLWPSHWVAWDLLEPGVAPSGSYTSQDKAVFTSRLEKQLSKCPDVPRERLQAALLQIYANPCKSKKALGLPLNGPAA